jgi:Flp pilus assembly protein TadD/ferredoxin
VLLGVHAIILAHVAHYVVTGRTVSPVEPSESMYTLELGRVNAGFIFFGLAILSTAIFGRFFCGWGCHLVALQDFCGWLMKKAGIKPQPFRSRLLLLGPLVLALYMFAWPTFARVVLGRGGPFPGFSNHVTTDAFWRTFPGPVFAVLTFATCGFLAVLLLGSKGFCTYGCPYGAIFVAADKIAPVRIVVNDRCDQSGHCTATCTSNVRVHEEVRLHGMVVDPGCMKCMDCVSVCPNDALSLGLARPALLAPAPKEKPASRFPLPLHEELALALVALVATLAFRGLYDGPPLLMAIGLGAITAFVALKLWQLARRPTVRLQSLTLRSGGQLARAGVVVAVAGTAWLALAAHSAFVQWHRAAGRSALERTEVPREAAISGRFDAGRTSSAHRAAVASATRHFGLADRWGIAEVPEIHLGLAWLHLLRHEERPAEARIRAALALHPDDPVLHDNLIDLLAARGRLPDAADALDAKLRQAADTTADRFRLGALLVGAGRLADALPHFARAVELAPDDPTARHDLGALLRRLGQPREAVVQLEAARAIAPSDPDVATELALALEASGDRPGAIAVASQALAGQPEGSPSQAGLGALVEALRAGAAR